MVDAYNMSAFEASNNVLDQFVAVDTISGGVLSVGFMLTLFVILLIALLRRNEIPESVFSAGAACMAISTMLWVAGAVNVLFILGFAIVAGGAAVAMYTQTTG